MGFRELLKEKEFIILDGATGTMIQKSGVQYDEVPETLTNLRDAATVLKKL